MEERKGKRHGSSGAYGERIMRDRVTVWDSIIMSYASRSPLHSAPFQPSLTSFTPRFARLSFVNRRLSEQSER